MSERGSGGSFGVLGPVAAWRHGRPLALGSPQQRAVLALLLLHRNRVVTTDRIVDVLWPDGAAPSARPVVRTYVSRLRRCLDSLGTALATHDHGYELRAAVDRVDADRFEALVLAGRDARQAADFAAAAAFLREALQLVRGEILTELGDDPAARLERARLGEVRLIAEEELVEVELATGGHRALVPRLTAAVAEDPLRERAWMQLMVALYRSGRQADALEAYRRASRALADELGLVPGRELQRLERMVLVHDRALDLPAPPGAGLPRYRTSFIGRERELAAVARALQPGRVVTAVGPPGAGKTRLAAEAAAALDRTRAGPLRWVDLAAADGPGVARTVARALALPEVPGRSPTDSVVARLRDCAGLLVLDNCEHVLEPVAALVGHVRDQVPAVRILITSREALGLGDEVVLQVAGLSMAAAARLLVDRASATPGAFTDDPTDAVSVAEVVRRLDGLPLAIELAAGKLRSVSIQELADGLRERLWLLGEGRRGAPARQRTLEAAIGWSHGLATPVEREVLRRLAVFPGPFDTAAAAAVALGEGAAQADVVPVLTRLVERSLLVVDRGGSRTRYRLLETVRAFAGERLREADEWDVAARRHCDAFIAFASELRRHLGDSDLAAWLARGRREHDNLHAALEWALARDDRDRALELASALGLYWWRSGHVAEGCSLLDRALALAKPGDPWWTRGLVWRSWLLHAAGAPEALEASRAAVAACDADTDTELVWLAAGGEALTLMSAGRPDEARPAVERAAHFAAAAASQEGIAYADQLRGVLHLREGDLDAAAHRLVDARDRYRRLRKGADAGWVLVDLARVRLAQGRAADAREAATDAAADFRRREDSRGLAGALVLLGLAHVAQGELRRGRLVLREAAELAERWDHAAQANEARLALDRLTSAAHVQPGV